MKNEALDILKENGADVDNSLKRFMGNRGLYEKFLLKFPEDQNMSNLRECMKNQNYGDAFKCVHTLKGVSANLGLNPIQELSSQMTELMRNKQADEIDKDALEKCFHELEEIYDNFCRIIEENQ